MPPIDPSTNFTTPQPQGAPNDATGWANATSYGGNMQGANQATQRFQGMGAAAAQRGPAQTNYGGFNTEMGQSQQSRAAGVDAMGMMRTAATGGAPSQAELLGRNMIDQSINGSMATAASARGGPLAQAAAMQNAQNAAGAQRQQGMNTLAAMRADEMAKARDAYFGAGATMRGQDFQGANTALGQNQLDLQNQQFNTHENDQTQLGFEQLGQNAQTAQMNAMGGQSQNAEKAWETQTGLDQHRTDSNTGLLAGAASAVGGILGGLSDVRAKTDLVPLDAAPGTADYVHAMGGDASLNGIGAGKGDAFATPNQPAGGKSFGDYLKAAFGPRGGAQGTPAAGGDAPVPFLRSAFGGFAQPMHSDPMTKVNVGNPGGTTELGRGGGMDVMGSLAANSAFGTTFAKHPAGGMMLSDPRAKAEAYALGRAHEHYGEPWSFERPKEDIRDDHASGGQGVLPAGVQPGQRYDPSRPTPAMLATPMAEANRALAPSEYEYKPQFTPGDQAPGEKNVGPMANAMASDPVAATAVKRDPGTGLLAIDRDKALKLTMGGVGALQHQVDGLAKLVAKKKAATR